MKQFLIRVIRGFRTCFDLYFVWTTKFFASNLLTMHRLIVNPGTESAWEIPLQRGMISLGRSAENDFPIEHPSVSSSHCQVRVADSGVTIKDLGSINGILIDGVLTEEAVLSNGQTIRLGDVTMQFAADETPAIPAAEFATAVFVAPTETTFCKFHPKSLARFFCPKCGKSFCDLCISARHTGNFCRVCSVKCVSLNQNPDEPEKPESFIRLARGAFLYPLKGDGAILLIAGGFFFLVLAAAKFFLRFVPGYGWVLLLLLTIFGAGYLTAYLRLILTDTALGRKTMPDWPEFTDFGSVAAPFFQLIGTIIFCFAPAIALTIYAAFNPNGSSWFGWSGTAAILFGCIYFPMAFTAVAMFDSIGAVNPLLVIPSILKIPREYLVTIILLVLVLVVRWLGETALPAILPIPILPTIIASFLGLYLLAVEMRILGLLYWTKKDELGWFKH
ncbi:MAG: FHA domain-containing protein [Limisphaerales bacterium]